MHGCNTRFDIKIKKDGAISLWFIEGSKIKRKVELVKQHSATKDFSEFSNKPTKPLSACTMS